MDPLNAATACIKTGSSSDTRPSSMAGAFVGSPRQEQVPLSELQKGSGNRFEQPDHILHLRRSQGGRIRAAQDLHSAVGLPPRRCAGYSIMNI